MGGDSVVVGAHWLNERGSRKPWALLTKGPLRKPNDANEVWLAASIHSSMGNEHPAHSIQVHI